MGGSDLDSKSDEQQEEAKDEFSKLTDDLLILILTKIRHQDFKLMFQCTLVSKRFASLVPLMPHVSISIFDSESFNSGIIQNPLILLRKFNRITSVDVLLLNDKYETMKERVFRSQSLQFPVLFDWKTNFSFNLQTIVFLFAQSIVVKTDEDEDEDEDIIIVTEKERVLRVSSCRLDVYGSGYLGNFVWRLLLEHPTLSEVTVARTKQGGEICLKEDETSSLRNSLKQGEISSIGRMGKKRKKMGTKRKVISTCDVKSGYIPILHLPSCGFTMKGVSLVVARVCRELIHQQGNTVSNTYSNDDNDFNNSYYNDDADILNWVFESEDGSFS